MIFPEGGYEEMPVSPTQRGYQQTKKKWIHFKCSPVNQYLIEITLRDMEKSDTVKALKVSQG